MLRIADETWIATALLHRENPSKEAFSISEIVARAELENMTGQLRPGLMTHASVHCVANKAPQPANLRMLYETSAGRRRLFRPNDIAHPNRIGKVVPAVNEIPATHSYLLEWYRSVYSGSPEATTRLPDLPNIEELARKAILVDLGMDLDLLVRILNTYLEGFRRQGNYTLESDRDPKLLVQALVARSFNTTLCSYKLLQDGYYQQSIALARMIDEDWVTSYDLLANQATQKALWDQQRPTRSFRQMASSISDAARDWWDTTYGTASEIAHPRGRALSLQFTFGDPSILHVGPAYERKVAEGALMFLIPASKRMLAVFNGMFALGLDEELDSITKAIKTWTDRLSFADSIELTEPAGSCVIEDNA